MITTLDSYIQKSINSTIEKNFLDANYDIHLNEEINLGNGVKILEPNEIKNTFIFLSGVTNTELIDVIKHDKCEAVQLINISPYLDLQSSRYSQRNFNTKCLELFKVKYIISLGSEIMSKNEYISYRNNPNFITLYTQKDLNSVRHKHGLGINLKNYPIIINLNLSSITKGYITFATFCKIIELTFWHGEGVFKVNLYNVQEDLFLATKIIVKLLAYKQKYLKKG